MANHNEPHLRAAILSVSESKDWAKARAEWDLAEIYFEDEPSRCLCTKYPIIEICVLRNRVNGNSAEVGNVCVNKFLGIPSKIVVDGIKRVAKDSGKGLNDAATHFAFRKDWISRADHDFSIDTNRKTVLSSKQAKWRADINRRVLLRMKRQR